MIVLSLVFFFWYTIIARAQVTGCSWAGFYPTPNLDPAPSATMSVGAWVVYGGINCTYTVTGYLTIIIGEIGYSASPVTFNFQPAPTSNETTFMTYNYPQLPVASLISLEGTSAEYVMVESLETCFNMSDWIPNSFLCSLGGRVVASLSSYVFNSTL
jgi:hypothetical protein